MTDQYSDFDDEANDDDEPVDLDALDALNAAAADKWLKEVEATIAEVARDMEADGRTGPQLITVDQLRAAGVFDVPPEFRKTLGVERNRHKGLFTEEHFLPDESASTDTTNDA